MRPARRSRTDSIPTTIFYKSETDAESGLLYAYNALMFLEYSRGIFYIGDIPTETMSPKSDEAR